MLMKSENLERLVGGNEMNSGLIMVRRNVYFRHDFVGRCDDLSCRCRTEIANSIRCSCEQRQKPIITHDSQDTQSWNKSPAAYSTFPPVLFNAATACC